MAVVRRSGRIMESAHAREADPRDVNPTLMGVGRAGSSEGDRRDVESLCSTHRRASLEQAGEFEDEGAQQEPPSSADEATMLLISIASGLDVVLSGIISVTAFSYAIEDTGVSLYCLGVQAVSHALSSVCLLLRFVGERALIPRDDFSPSQSLLRTSRRRFLIREQVLGECMGIVMLISSCALLFKAFRKLRFWTVWYRDHQLMDDGIQRITEILAWYGFTLYVVQGVVRFRAGRKLRRQIIWSGFVASVVSLIFLLFLGLAASYEKSWSWKAEPIVAIILVLVTLVEAIRIVIMHLDDVDTRLRHNLQA